MKKLSNESTEEDKMKQRVDKRQMGVFEGWTKYLKCNKTLPSIKSICKVYLQKEGASWKESDLYRDKTQLRF